MAIEADGKTAAVVVRYRDIAWTEIPPDHRESLTSSTGLVTAEEWATWRGQSVMIFTPAISDATHPTCEGPWFLIGVQDDELFYVCPHLVEVGD